MTRCLTILLTWSACWRQASIAGAGHQLDHPVEGIGTPVHVKIVRSSVTPIRKVSPLESRARYVAEVFRQFVGAATSAESIRLNQMVASNCDWNFLPAEAYSNVPFTATSRRAPIHSFSCEGQQSNFLPHLA
jgi:hypothetical protein